MRFNNKKEAWKKAIKVLQYWKDKNSMIFQDKDTKIEALLEITMNDSEEKVDKICKSKYFVEFERNVFGEYAVFRFPYRKR
ncbi:MAG: hypothetical protein KKA65_01275 [Nanoarchaeota archaeon]|nr:hypothetical protein [Nanoarchaeota archaeon]MBU4351939.1 hypothetical protein [Nanoarchaeota archaeon]MBU4456111.1 hypothetical protein [Nanoarchaeota archaeon]MCG2720154.1 hypothetical protein [Nanoarchaeota archaeon]